MKSSVLIQLDPDSPASTFDSVVAIDSGVDQLLVRQGVTPETVDGLVHGAMFTRGPQDLHRTAIFIGGSAVAASEALAERTLSCFFGPMRVSVMMDPNGSNTTAAAAVLCVQRHLDLAGRRVLILGGTGPVGQRIAGILARATGASGLTIDLASRSLQRATDCCRDLQSNVPSETATFCPVEIQAPEQATAAQAQADILFAAGAAGVELIDDGWRQADKLQVAVDLNAVPPAGIRGVEAMDHGESRDGTTCYGPIGVGGLKMKIHRQAIRQLFEANDQVLDTDAIYGLGRELESDTGA